MSEAQNEWIQTWSGGQFFYDEEFREQSTIKIQDICCSLARKPRCAGHGQRVMSIAEHSVVVSYIVEALGGGKYAQLHGLLHDAHEAYSGDMPSPMKRYLKRKFGWDIKEVEADLTEHIYAKLNIAMPGLEASTIVQQADQIALYFERQLNMKKQKPWPFTDKLQPPAHFGYLFEFNDPSDAAERFKNRYLDLRDKSVV